MATSQALSGPTPAPGGGVMLAPPSPEKLQQLFDNGIWYALSLWPALHVACQNGWGGENTSDKKDWFAGAVSTLFGERKDIDQDDLEIFLLQIMQDEFDCNVEDESEVEVARTMMALRKRLMERDLSYAKELEQRWKNRGQMKMNIQVIDNEQEVDDDEWEGFGDGDGDVDMDAAEDFVPNLVPVLEKREKPEPEVDDDGFTKVVGKKKK